MAKKTKAGAVERAERVVMDAFDEQVRPLSRDDYESVCDLIRQNMQCRIEASKSEREEE